MKHLRNILHSQKGFTLLEIMIAVGIMVVALGAIFMVQSNSIESARRTREMNTVAMLAKNAMVDAEIEFQGRTFSEVKDEKTGNFKEPYEKFKWKREIKEIKFPELNFSAPDEEGNASTSTDRTTEIMGRLISNFLSKAIREVTVTVSWKNGDNEKSFKVSTYWVNLNHEFSFTE